jgi:hypothetical protein
MWIEEPLSWHRQQGKWEECADNSADAVTRLSEVTDKINGLLMKRADALMGCLEGRPRRGRTSGAYQGSSTHMKACVGRLVEFQAARADP